VTEYKRNCKVLITYILGK